MLKIPDDVIRDPFYSHLILILYINSKHTDIFLYVHTNIPIQTHSFFMLMKNKNREEEEDEKNGTYEPEAITFKGTFFNKKKTTQHV